MIIVADYRYGPSGAKEGGLVSLKHGGEFSGMVPGEGHGMEDNVYMPIVEKGHGSQVGTLAVSPSPRIFLIEAAVCGANFSMLNKTESSPDKA